MYINEITSRFLNVCHLMYFPSDDPANDNFFGFGDHTPVAKSIDAVSRSLASKSPMIASSNNSIPQSL